ncbi:HNH endonuclease [Galactobacter valiniphilus]|uniref:HNH endonuclease n=1 Tax=Galactobacter valiniphilus TaxID=2676122 RepID=A0A399J7G3_9MICC|nr:HNH endonuclease signature motif containing protein [Galactobacter valiniphilus]RII41244.1 HNH endonuclease [Galactobacter valiniphilus]
MLSSNALQEATSRVRQTLAWSPGSWDAASEPELVDVLGAAADLSRAVDALRVSVAGAVSRRSEGFNRAESFAARLGFRATKPLLMQAFGIQAPTADLLISLAQATAPRSGFSAGELSPFRPALAAALRAGELSADQAAAVHRELPHPSAPESIPGMIAAAEVSLVAEATGGRIDLSRPPAPNAGQRHGDRAAAGTQGTLGAPGGAGAPPDAGPTATPGSAAGTGTGTGTGTEPAAAANTHTQGERSAGPWGNPRSGAAAARNGTRDTDLRDQDPWGGRRLEVHHVRNQAKVWANHIDPDGPEPRYEEQQQRRALRLRAARGGGYTLSGFAPEAEGALLLSVLDGFTAPGSRRGEAASAQTASHATLEGSPDGDAPTDRSSDQQNFDALHALVEEHVRSGATAAGVGASSALVVTVTLSALADYLAASEAGLVEGQGTFPGAALAGGLFRSLDGERRVAGVNPHGSETSRPERGSNPSGASTGSLGPAFTTLQALTRDREAQLSRTDQPVPLSALAARLCEDAVSLLVTDDAGSPLAYGRSRRLFSPQQRRVLTVRDGGCRAPGCNAPPGWCHAHHVIPWERGGASDVDNAVLLCSFHHHEVHRGRLVALPTQGGNGSPRIVSALTARALEKEQHRSTEGSVARPPGHAGLAREADPTSGVGPTRLARPANLAPLDGAVAAARPSEPVRIDRSATQGLRSPSPVWSATLPSEPGRPWTARYRCHHRVNVTPVEHEGGRLARIVTRPSRGHPTGGSPGHLPWQPGGGGRSAAGAMRRRRSEHPRRHREAASDREPPPVRSVRCRRAWLDP